ncbi:MAG: hypothetical protein BWY80_00597 [Firmicutes bacterium ADurb.Bin456]|nr:MAG: hypothetical protein BWY80_00597 [Firmicutes bacterium ADurb.Bin456]
MVNQALPQINQIQTGRIGLFLVPEQVDVFVAGSPKGVFFTFNQDHVYGALAIAFLPAPRAGKGLAVGDFALRQLRQVVAGRLQQPQGQPVFNLQGHTEGSHKARLRGHDNLLAGEGRHGRRDSPVVADTALHKDLSSHGPVTLHPVIIIQANRVNQARGQVFQPRPLLDGCFDIAADKGSTLVAEVQRPCAL